MALCRVPDYSELTLELGWSVSPGCRLKSLGFWVQPYDSVGAILACIAASVDYACTF